MDLKRDGVTLSDIGAPVEVASDLFLHCQEICPARFWVRQHCLGSVRKTAATKTVAIAVWGQWLETSRDEVSHGMVSGARRV